VSGLAEDGFLAAYKGEALNPAAGSAYRGVGFDSTIVLSGFSGYGNIASAITYSEGTFASQTTGFHFVSAIEWASAATATYYGNTANLIWSWLDFSWRC
jgi:hypothetical protein